MGSPEKLFTPKQLEKLDKKQRAALKREIKRHLEASTEIKRILRQKVRPKLDELHGRKPRKKQAGRKQAATKQVP